MNQAILLKASKLKCAKKYGRSTELVQSSGVNLSDNFQNIRYTINK
ncbi:MAG TPA: hypothetical protein V6D28_26230 [Leptolyngbyaceae cyanobacterium]